MQEAASGAGSAKTSHRNTAGLISHASPHFAAAQLDGLMALYVHPSDGRAVELPVSERRSERVVDFVRCSYLGLDNHPQSSKAQSRLFGATERYTGPAPVRGSILPSSETSRMLFLNSSARGLSPILQCLPLI